MAELLLRYLLRVLMFFQQREVSKVQSKPHPTSRWIFLRGFNFHVRKSSEGLTLPQVEKLIIHNSEYLVKLGLKSWSLYVRTQANHSAIAATNIYIIYYI